MESNLVKLVDATGKKVAGVAKEAGIPDGTLRSYYKGTRQIGRKHQLKLAKYFNVSIGYLMGLEEIENAPIDDIDKGVNLISDASEELSAEQKLKVLAYISKLKQTDTQD